ncbi:MAG: LPXTG cell wall anchor domain-containing protein [Ardenticatenia bacterium]|nr:LPXTG cell wall anchor domain-containing protein [Ardenticatenia bacterium]
MARNTTVIRYTLVLMVGVVFLGLARGAGLSTSYAAPAAQRATPTLTPTPPPTATPLPPPTDTPAPPPTTVPPSPTFIASPSPGQPPPTSPPSDTPPTPRPPRPEESPTPSPPACFTRLEGFVLDRESTPVVDALVRLLGLGWSAEWRTDTNGFFYFNGLCQGEATVEAIVNDQVVARVDVRLEGEGTVQVTLRSEQPSAQPTATGAPATATPLPSPTPSGPTPTPQVVTRLPQTGSSTLSMLLVAGVLAMIMFGVRVIRQYRHSAP